MPEPSDRILTEINLFWKDGTLANYQIVNSECSLPSGPSGGIGSLPAENYV